MTDAKTDTKMSTPDNRKFVIFSHAFCDPWAGGGTDDAGEVTLAFRFAKPTKTQIQRLQDKAVKTPAQAARNLLMDTVHPDDKDALQQSMEAYPGAGTSFATAIIKGVGISNDLGN